MIIVAVPDKRLTNIRHKGVVRQTICPMLSAYVMFPRIIVYNTYCPLCYPRARRERVTSKSLSEFL